MITKNWRHLLIVSLTSALFALASVASATYYGYIVERSHNKDVTLFFYDDCGWVDGGFAPLYV